MNEKNTNILINYYSELYSKDFYFECGEGWFKTLFNLSKEIIEYCKSENCEIPIVQQVKEKFGTLRYYILCGNDEIFEIIRKYELLSSKTCEICGNVGKLRNNHNWLTTLCNFCYYKIKICNIISIFKYKILKLTKK